MVRRRWNAAETAAVAVEALWQFHFRNDAGGVCRALPRAFVWCDHLDKGALGHVCRDGPPPHELLVCILRNDNPDPVYQRLLAMARR
jgi:hypothetical protein